MSTTYHQFRADDGSLYGSFKVFNWSKLESDAWAQQCERCEELMPPGWYWQEGKEGEIPDSFAHGPFETEADALAAALER